MYTSLSKVDKLKDRIQIFAVYSIEVDQWVWMGIVEENIFELGTEGTQNIFVSREWSMNITDQCYIRELGF